MSHNGLILLFWLALSTLIGGATFTYLIFTLGFVAATIVLILLTCSHTVFLYQMLD
jgi:hypothetical protein